MKLLPHDMAPSSSAIGGDALRMRDSAISFLPPTVAGDRARLVAAAGRYLANARREVDRLHRLGSGIAAARLRTDCMDGLLSRLLSLAIEVAGPLAPSARPNLALVALGGYGRRELCPFSDIDLMFLVPDWSSDPEAARRFLAHVADFVLYPLWDLRMKVGHSVRTVKEALEEARRSVETKNALLEARFIDGSELLFGQFQSAYRNYYLKDNPMGYVRERMHAQAGRRARLGSVVQLQEPDIKNGVGGLRDYQNILWMAAIRYDASSIDDLRMHDLLSAEELRTLVTGHDFLMRVRTELHLQSGRANDCLRLDMQAGVAWAMGYRIPEMLPRVEALMRDYFRHARAIHRLVGRLEQRMALAEGRLEIANILAARRIETKQTVDGLVLRGHTLSAANSHIFRDDPVRLVRVFRHAQQLQAVFDPHLESLIEDALHLVDERVVESPAAAKAFLSILQCVGEVHPAIAKMHELGVLQRYLPEFDGIDCLVQHELYHVYTADEHTLQCLAALDRVFKADDPRQARYLEALRETANPALLYLTLLLHDVGKQRGIKGHAETGVDIARPMLERLGVDGQDAKAVLHTIRHHLSMARIWHRHDLSDPSTAQAFAERMETEDNLRYLYVCTFCDAQSTAPGLWNGSKDQLHGILYRKTLESLRTASAPQAAPGAQDMVSVEEVLAVAPELGEEEVRSHFELMPESYRWAYDAGEYATHLRLLRAFRDEEIPAAQAGDRMPEPRVRWNNDMNLGQSVVHIVWRDEPGLFAREAGSMTLSRLNIEGGRIHSRSDGYSVNSIRVTDGNGNIVRDKRMQEAFRRNLCEVLLGRLDLESGVAATAAEMARGRQLRRVRRGIRVFEARTKLYCDATSRRIILEVRAGDRPGLLYRIARAIYENGFDIEFSRIDTELDHANDTFYVRPVSASADENGYLSLWRDMERIIGEE